MTRQSTTRALEPIQAGLEWVIGGKSEEMIADEAKKKILRLEYCAAFAGRGVCSLEEEKAGIEHHYRKMGFRKRGGT